MVKFLAVFLASIFFGAASSPDKYVSLYSGIQAAGPANGQVYNITAGKTLKAPALNPALKNLILIQAGQSLWSDIVLTPYVPVNAAKLDQMNIQDGGIYTAADPLLGQTYNNTGAPYGNASTLLRTMDSYATSKFDRVIGVPITIGATSISQWDIGGELEQRICQAIERLRDRQIVPGGAGTTWALKWNQGEGDLGTPQATYQAALLRIIAKAQGCANNFLRVFVARETWIAGATDANVENAQVAVVNNVTVFSGGNMDGQGAGFRVADNTHWNDAGSVAASVLEVAAMAASGAPF